jgi:hypothetical protein
MTYAQRRPLASAFASVLPFFSNCSLAAMMILQACLLAPPPASLRTGWQCGRGFWAATAFFGLTYIYARFFVATALTEPLGLLWARREGANSVELTFWALLWVSIVVSSSLVYFDDGTRTLAAIPDCRSPTRPWSLAAAGCRASC